MHVKLAIITRSQLHKYYEYNKNSYDTLQFSYIDFTNYDLYSLIPKNVNKIMFQACTFRSIDASCFGDNLKELIFERCNIEIIPSLPDNLTNLAIVKTPVTYLPDYFPSKLKRLHLENTKITKLINLPNLFELIATINPIDEIDAFPETLRMIYICSNMLTKLPKLPPYLLTFHCDHNPLKELPEYDYKSIPDLSLPKIH